MNKKFNFPIFSSLLTISLFLFCVISLLIGLQSAQERIMSINNIHLPLMENSSILIRVNRDIHDSFTKNSNNSINVSKVNALINIADSTLTEINQIIKERSITPINRDDLVRLEKRILENKVVTSDDLRRYKELQNKFQEDLSQKIEKALVNRDTYIDTLIKNNNAVMIGSILILLICSILFFRLACTLKKSVTDNDNLLTKLFEANSEIESLIRVMSHDISTPISVILSYSRLKLDEGASEGNQKKLSTIRTCATNIKEILTHIKEMQSLRDGKRKVNLLNVKIYDMLNQLKEVYGPKLEDKQLSLNINIEDKDLEVIAEPACLKNQILSNIISNCIKFSHQGSSIDIDIENNNDYVEIIIRDHGIGMPEDILRNIFKPDSSTTRKGTLGEKGTGYGMPILKNYIELMQGSVTVQSIDQSESETDHGTVFSLKLKASNII